MVSKLATIALAVIALAILAVAAIIVVIAGILGGIGWGILSALRSLPSLAASLVVLFALLAYPTAKVLSMPDKSNNARRLQQIGMSTVAVLGGVATAVLTLVTLAPDQAKSLAVIIAMACILTVVATYSVVVIHHVQREEKDGQEGEHEHQRIRRERK